MKILANLLLLLQGLFGATLALSDPFDYSVLGVIASSQIQKGIALIKQKSSGKVNALREGQDLAPGYKVTRVYRKTVNFSFNNKFYAMNVGEDVPTEIKGFAASDGGSTAADNLYQADGIEQSGNILKITRNLKENLVGLNLNKILMQASAVPRVENGRLIGFELREIDKGSIFDIAGLKNGDIITHINSQPINDASLAIKALSVLKSSTSATFGYLRGQLPMELVIQTN